MSKRSRPLSDIAWALLGPGDKHTKRARPIHSEVEQDDDDEIEEETVHIDDGAASHNDQQQQQHGLAILNSMTVDKTTSDNNGRKGPANVQEDIPTVPLDNHYNALYNRIMNKRFPPEYVTDSSGSGDEEDDDGNMDVEHLFESIAHSTGSRSPVSASDSPRTKKRKQAPPIANHNRRKEKSRRLVQTEAYNTEERQECFLCSWGNRYHDGLKAKDVNVLQDIMEQYAGCNNVDLALQLHLYYKEKVYRPNSRMAMLTKEIALEHIEGLHSLSATLFLGESIRACKKIMFGFQNAIFKANLKYDKEAVIQFKEMLKLLCMLYKMNPDQMLFNYGKTREDTSSMGRPFTIMTQMKQVKDKDKRTKRTRQMNTTNESFNRGFDI